MALGKKIKRKKRPRKFRMGNTCIPVADSFWYLAKLIQLCKIKKKKENCLEHKAQGYGIHKDLDETEVLAFPLDQADLEKMGKRTQPSNCPCLSPLMKTWTSDKRLPGMELVAQPGKWWNTTSSHVFSCFYTFSRNLKVLNLLTF